MNQTIPLFPLPLVVFPGQALPFHIFEPRYREMLADVREAQGQGEVVPIGISLGEDSEVNAEPAEVQTSTHTPLFACFGIQLTARLTRLQYSFSRSRRPRRD